MVIEPYLIEGAVLQSLANLIRESKGEPATTKYLPAQFSSELSTIIDSGRYLIKRASGEIASFSDAVAAPLVGLRVALPWRSEGYQAVEVSASYTALPLEYQPVEYLEGDGNQEIRTFYVPVNKDQIYAEVLSNGISGTTSSIFSASLSGTYQINSLTFGDGIIFCKYFASGAAQQLRVNIADGTWKKFIVSEDGVFSCDGVSVRSPYEGPLESGNTLGFFSRFKGKVRAGNVSNSGVEKINLIPVVRKNDNKPGMFDTVTGHFFTNALNDSDYISGPSTPLPTDYETTITLPTTIYGGYLDAVTGQLVATHDANGNLLVNQKLYFLPPININALAGGNNVWSDAGDVTVSYRVEQ